MKKIAYLIITLALACWVNNVLSQQGVAINTNNTPPDASSILDVSSQTGGLLIPRMSYVQRNSIANPVEGLLIYQNNATPGFYYYDGSAWGLIGSGAFAINDLYDGKTAGNNIFLGLDAGANDDGTDNMNVAVGRSALISNISGSMNTAAGNNALYSNTTGGGNVALGHAANLYNTEGNNNTIIGLRAGRGSEPHSKSGNVFIGYRAGFNDTTDNKLYIENSDADSSTALIYGEFDNHILAFNADVGIGTAVPDASLDIRSKATHLPATLNLGNSDNSHKLFIFPGHNIDPNPFIQWKAGDPLRFATDEGEYDWSEKMRITSDGRVGIGTDSPEAGLHVHDTSGMVFTSDNTCEGGIPVEGSGRRLMWYPAKAAFRAGIVSGPQWNEDSIGSCSAAIGSNTIAKGPYSIAMGGNTTATGYFSTAMGDDTEASGQASTAMGFETKASNWYSTAMGRGTTASGTTSTAMGHLTIASADYSTATGRSTTASGVCSTAMGRSTTASGSNSSSMGFLTMASGWSAMAMGLNTIASGPNTLAIGDDIEANGDHSIAIALSDQNGLSVTQANTMAVMGGKVGIGTVSPNKPFCVYTDNISEIALFDNESPSDPDGIVIRTGPDANPGDTVDFIIFQDGDGSLVGSIDGDGTGGVNYNETSDARLKTKIRDYSGGLHTLSQIQVRKYEMKSAPGIEKIGLIAQELLEVYPQAVSGSPDNDVNTDPMMVDYGKITPLLVNAFQELEKLTRELIVKTDEIDELKKEIELLKKDR